MAMAMANYFQAFDSLSSLTPYLVCSVLLLILIEQISYLKKKRSIPGPTFVFPFVGNAIALVRDPTKFWDLQSDAAKSSPLGICANYVVGKFIVFIRDTELSHKVLVNVRPDAFDFIGHPFGKKLFGDHNLIYLTGQAHKDVRHSIAPNFSNRALSTYTALQQIIIRQHLEAWERLASASSSSSIPLRFLIRDMNLETSQTVYVGSHLDGASREKFNVEYDFFNVGLMKLPIDLPGTGFRRAKIAVERLIETLSICAERSRARMKVDGDEAEPTCLVDFWMKDTLKEALAAEEDGKTAPANLSDVSIGSYLFDFLYAAQDASTSSLLWAVALLESHPKVLGRVREEVEGIWSANSESPITLDMLSSMKYTQAVAREVVRLRAPATMVPHIAAVDFPLTDTYTVPKGTIVFPSVFESCLQGFTEPERFDPDRFSEERQEDRVFKRNFLAFGVGAHRCVGQRYALNHLVLFIAMFSSFFDFERDRSDGCDDIVYVPTICPKDDCKVFLRRRSPPLDSPPVVTSLA